MKIICVQPFDYYYKFQVQTWLHSLRKLGLSDKAIVMLFRIPSRDKEDYWEDLRNEFNEAQWFICNYDYSIDHYRFIYIPVIRPYTLSKYWELNPEISSETIVYTDCDIIFRSNFNINSLLHDDVCYLSNTVSYISASYFDSKIRDVKPEMLERYKEIDVLDEACKLVGINRKIAEENNDNSGGAQYVLKNIDKAFWDDVLKSSMNIVIFLRSINQAFFESENKGFQSWCSDMWAVLWNLWKRNRVTKVVPELDFHFSTTALSNGPFKPIIHNSGVTSDFMDLGEHKSVPMFNKTRYVNNNLSPLHDKGHVENVLNNEVSKKFANWYYLNEVVEALNSYKNIHYKF